MNQNKAVPEFFQDIMDITKNTLDQFAILGAETISENIAQSMCQMWDGQYLYFPKNFYLKSKRNAEIYALYLNNAPVWSIARQYALTPQAVWYVIRQIDKEKKADQLQLI